MYILIVFFALGSVSTHDIIVGSNPGGKKIFDEHFQASPAVWRQTQNVTINTTDDEVISRIVVTDLREEKDGDAKIVDGGEGQKKVTIELKSPTVLRGYDFKVEVYAEPNKEFQANPPNNYGLSHPSQFKTSAVNFNTPNPGSKITLTNLDPITKLPETPKTQASPSDAKVQTPGNARETRDIEVKKAEENKSKVEVPSLFGNQNKAVTTVKSKDNNAPVTTSRRLFTKEAEEKSTEINNDEARRVRATHEVDMTTKNTPKAGSFDSKTTTTSTTFKTPSFNTYHNNPANHHPVSVADDREARATHKDDETVNPTLVPSQLNPTIYTPNFEGHVPSLIMHAETGKKEDKPVNDNNKNLNNQRRDARDTHDEAKENTPKTLADDLPKIGITNKNAENITKDEERKIRGAQDGPEISPINGETKEVSSTTQSTSTTKKNVKESENDGTDKHSLNPVLIRSQDLPVPYPYGTTSKVSTTTKSPQKRDTEPSGSKVDDKTILSPKLFGGQNSTNHEKMPIVSLQLTERQRTANYWVKFGMRGTMGRGALREYIPKFPQGREK